MARKMLNIEVHPTDESKLIRIVQEAENGEANTIYVHLSQADFLVQWLEDIVYESNTHGGATHGGAA